MQPEISEIKEKYIPDGLHPNDNGHTVIADKLEKFLKSGIPIFMVCGDSDTIVPYNEKGKILSDYFKSNNGNLTEIVKVGCDHHPHGL